jgi:glycosyltransferase involved in cell wall biosynthesis
MSKLSTSTKDVTAIVATHEREEALDNMVLSFRNFFPDLKIVVVDSSSTPNKRDDVTHICVGVESGISVQRNIALDLVRTELFLLLDDDFVCTEKTYLFDLLEEEHKIPRVKFSEIIDTINDLDSKEKF